MQMRKLSGYGPSIIVLATALLVLFAGPRVVQQLTYEQTKTRVIQARNNLEATDILQQLNGAYADIARTVEPSVVHVSASYLERQPFGPDRPGLSTGSGWVFDEHGHVVTNHHVVQNALRIDVQLYNGEIRPADVIGTDPSTDIAVLKIEPGRLHAAELGDIKQPVDQGDLVFAFGSPFDFRFSMSSGVVSGKDRHVGVIRNEGGRQSGYENFIQVDAAINPGNSGGPLTDYRGRVIGMNTAIATGRRAEVDEGQFAGIGLAIPIDMILPVVTQLIETGHVEKGFMGVEPMELSPIIAQQLGFNGQGVFILKVSTGGPARFAGVRANDIVTHVAGRAVGSVPQLRSLVSSVRPGETVRLTIWRYNSLKNVGESIDLDVNLTSLDNLVSDGGIAVPQRSRDAIPELGIARMATNTRELGEQYRIAEYLPGVIILGLVPNSFLAQQVEPGSVIVDVMDYAVTNVDDLFTALENFDFQEYGGLRATAITPAGKRVVIRLRTE